MTKPGILAPTINEFCSSPPFSADNAATLFEQVTDNTLIHSIKHSHGLNKRGGHIIIQKFDLNVR